MSDTTAWTDATGAYWVLGLHDRAIALTRQADGLRAQMAERTATVSRVLGELHGAAAVLVHEHTAAALARSVELEALLRTAARACADPGHPPAFVVPEPQPRLPSPNEGMPVGTSGADPVALRRLASASADWDDQVRRAAATVHLDDVRAWRAPPPPGPPGASAAVLTAGGLAFGGAGPASERIDPSSVVHLPPVAGVAARLAARSNDVGELATLAARAFEHADRATGPLWRARYRAHVIDAARRAMAGGPDHRTELARYWTDRALARAGIDGDRWRPELGAEANLDPMVAVYRYYGDLYLEHPDRFWWAGMANLVGATFGAGILDLGALADLARRLGQATRWLRRIPGLDLDELDALAAAGAIPEAELVAFEQRLLAMQKEIFLDQAMMHEAYRTGGLTAIDELLAAGLIDEPTATAWHDIDSGDPSRVAAGTTQLVRREQLDIIADDYDALRQRPGSGPALTYTMTAVGLPSLPGARSFADVFPVEATATIDGPDDLGGCLDVPVIPKRQPVRLGCAELDLPDEIEITVRTPLPAGNIADADDRWRYITADTLPAMLTLATTHADRLRALVATPIDARIAEQRLGRQAPAVAKRLTDLDVDVQVRNRR